MIFFNTNKNKITILAVLTVLASTTIFWQWLKFTTNFQVPLVEENKLNVIEDIQQQTGELLVDAKDSIVQGVEQVQVLKTEVEKAQEQEQLLEVTRSYLENKE